MLVRKLEPEFMDTPEEAHDYDSMDHSTVNRLFAADFLSGWNGLSPVLDLGTGTAQIPIELCRQHAEIHLVAIDAARHMIELATTNVEKANIKSRIHLKVCDAKALPFEDDTFAAIISNSIVHHIPEPMHVLRELVRVLAPGGVIFLRDLLRPVDEASLQHLVDLHAAGANNHQRQMFADSLHAALTVSELRDLVSQLGFDPSTVKQTSDRHWTWSARKKNPG